MIIKHVGLASRISVRQIPSWRSACCKKLVATGLLRPIQNEDLPQNGRRVFSKLARRSGTKVYSKSTGNIQVYDQGSVGRRYKSMVSKLLMGKFFCQAKRI